LANKKVRTQRVVDKGSVVRIMDAGPRALRSVGTLMGRRGCNSQIMPNIAVPSARPRCPTLLTEAFWRNATLMMPMIDAEKIMVSMRLEKTWVEAVRGVARITAV